MTQQKNSFTIEKLEERIQDERMQVWLTLRKAVIKAFEEHGEITEKSSAELLSNTLLDMDDAFKGDY